MSKQLRRFYDFGGYRLDRNNHRVTRHDGEAVSLTPKEFEVLLVLVENAGDTVSKETLLESVWSDSFVGDETLTRNISWLRKKLGVGDAGEKFIETVPKRGYRFAITVEASDEDELVIEEETLTRLSVEETLTFDAPKLAVLQPRIALLPGPPPRRRSVVWPLLLTCAVAAAAVVALLTYIDGNSNSGPRAILAARVAPFTGSPGREDMPSFSPDGKQIVFVWNGPKNESAGIYVKLIGAGDPVRLTNTRKEEMYPVFSPDSRHIAFVRAFPDHEEVILIPSLGGAERKLCDLRSGRASISFSPDGKHLAVADIDPALGVPAIFVFDLSSGERRRLTDSADGVIENTPRFSPDGKSIAFLRYFSDNVQELMIAPASGGAPRAMTADNAKIRSIAWVAEGKRINFVSLRQNSRPNLWQIETVRGAQPELISTSGRDIGFMAVSPNGKTVAFVEQTNDLNIWQITPGGAPARKMIESTSTDVDPQYSPDGKRILFASERSGNGEIWVADADGRNQRQLTDSAVSMGSPRFSPDGKFVAYNSQARQIYIVSAEGGAPRQLTPDGSNGALPSWSADGQSINFISDRSGSTQLWRMLVAGGAAVQITKAGAFESFASPDGKWVYYSRGREVAGLWRVPANGGDEEEVPALAAAGFWRAWTATPAGIYYVAYTANPPYKIMFYNFSNEQISEVAVADKPPLLSSASLGVSPDGKTILYAQSDSASSSIMLAELEK